MSANISATLQHEITKLLEDTPQCLPHLLLSSVLPSRLLLAVDMHQSGL